MQSHVVPGQPATTTVDVTMGQPATPTTSNRTAKASLMLGYIHILVAILCTLFNAIGIWANGYLKVENIDPDTGETRQLSFYSMNMLAFHTGTGIWGSVFVSVLSILKFEPACP